MSFAIALESTPETVENLQKILVVLNASVKDAPFVPLEELPPSHTVSQEDIENLVDWIEDMIKVLTDYTLFVDAEV